MGEVGKNVYSFRKSGRQRVFRRASFAVTVTVVVVISSWSGTSIRSVKVVISSVHFTCVCVGVCESLFNESSNTSIGAVL
jgi:hypothetical protein